MQHSVFIPCGTIGKLHWDRPGVELPALIVKSFKERFLEDCEHLWSTEERNDAVCVEKVQLQQVQEVIGEAKEQSVAKIIEGYIATWRRLFLILHVILFHKQPF